MPMPAASKACPPFPGALSREQVMALQLLLLHFRALEPKELRIGDVELYADNPPLTRHDIRNMLAGRSLLQERATDPAAKQAAFYSRMHNLLVARWPRVAGNDTLLDLFGKVYGAHAVGRSPAPAFNMRDEWFHWTGSERDQLLARYAGDYLCLRYARNTLSALEPDIVVSMLSIRDGTDGNIPYSLYYRSRHQEEEAIEGRLAVVGPFVYLIGLNAPVTDPDKLKTPHIMAGPHRPQEPRVRGFPTLLFRHTGAQQIVAAKVWMLPVEAIGITVARARDAVGVWPAPALEEHLDQPAGRLDEIKRKIRNDTAFAGRGCLSLDCEPD